MVFAFGGLRASNFLHTGMLERIMRAPMSFFDTIPIGRIVNRFSKDVDVCDNTLRMDFETFLSCLLNVDTQNCPITRNCCLVYYSNVGINLLLFLGHCGLRGDKLQYTNLHDSDRSDWDFVLFHPALLRRHESSVEKARVCQSLTNLFPFQ